MKRSLRYFTLLVSILALVACAASAPKIALNSDVRQGLKRIAVVQTPEPSEYFVNPGQLPGGYALYMFGALGGAILGGIESSRIHSASSKFTAAVTPLNPDLSGTLFSEIEKGLRVKGYDVIQIPAPPKRADGKEYDLSKIEGQFDAILLLQLNGGYNANNGPAAPQVNVAASLISRSTNDKIYSSSYSYSLKKFGDVVQIEPEAKFQLGSVDAIYSDVNIAVEGLRTGTRKIAERMVADL